MKALALALVLLVSACCYGPSRRGGVPLTEASYPWTWRAVSERPGDFMWQQTIDARMGEHTFHLDAVLQKRGDELVLVGLTPFGSKAFALTQRGTETTFESFIDRAPPFPPKFMLIDVQRAYWPFGVAPDDSAEASATTTQHGEEKVTESWRVGLLEWRTFTVEGKPGAIEIRYEGWKDGAPERVTIKNDWFGYTMDIRTTNAQAL